ncbi:S-adenosyl-L-methionine-dependent methyltransferase [Trinorchestia longiramus]|nr:S-adenosyl-L-methionine-dependent methyltransferase [Trinorchestia longiramus]
MFNDPNRLHPNKHDIEEIALEDGSAVDKICSSVNWKEVTEQVQMLISLFPSASNNGCICLPGEDTEDQTAILDSDLRCFGPEYKKSKQSCDDHLNTTEHFKMGKQSCCNKNINLLSNIDSGTISDDNSAQTLTSNHPFTCVKIPSTRDCHHSDDSHIHFRASCRVTGKLKKLLNRITSKEKFNSFNHECSAPKNSNSRLLIDKDREKNSPISHLNFGDIAMVQNELDHVDVKVKRLKKGDSTDSEMASKKHELCVSMTTSKQTGVLDCESVKKEKTQALTSSVDGDTGLGHDSGKTHAVPSTSVVQHASNGTITNVKTMLLSRLVEAVLQGTQNWCLDWNQPQVDVYLNITDLHVLLGVSLRRCPMSLRPYIPHIGLRSTLSSLMVHLALNASAPRQLKQRIQPQLTNIREEKHIQSQGLGISDDDSGGSIPASFLDKRKHFTLLDPMCGTGTLLAEAVHSFDVSHVIGCDVSSAQLQLAACNLYFSPAASLLCADAAALPLQSMSVDAVVCDFPFGQQHQPYLARTGKIRDDTSAVDVSRDKSMELLELVLVECTRVVVAGGSVVLLLPASKETQFQHMCSERTRAADGSCLQLMSTHHLALGTSSGLVCVLQKSSVPFQKNSSDSA